MIGTYKRRQEAAAAVDLVLSIGGGRTCDVLSSRLRRRRHDDGR
jgi:hypothetical protein